MAARDSSAYTGPSLSRNDTLEIIFTSGTTSDPRGVVISHGNVLANIEPLEREIHKYLRYERIFHPVRFLNLLPLSHVFGQMLGIFIPPFLAGTVVFIDSLKPSEIIDVIRRERISVLVAVPRFIESLQREIHNKVERDGLTRQFNEDFVRAEKEHFLRRWWRFRRIRSRFGWKFWAFISGGAALPEHVEAFWTRLGYAAIQGYGMTETTSLISLNHPFHTAPGSIGKVFPGVEVRVDEQGEILVRGENVAKAYRREDGAQPVAETDGWFRTGDLAESDARWPTIFQGAQEKRNRHALRDECISRRFGKSTATPARRAGLRGDRTRTRRQCRAVCRAVDGWRRFESRISGAERQSFTRGISTDSALVRVARCRFPSNANSQATTRAHPRICERQNPCSIAVKRWRKCLGCV